MTFPAQPPDQRRQGMIQEAAKVFLVQGYADTSMEQLAIAIGVAKQTLYNHFESKEKLFGEVVRQGASVFLVPLAGAWTDLREMLLVFGRRFRGLLLSAEGLAMYRMIVAETGRFPDLGQPIRQAGPGLARQQLAGVLVTAMERGQMRVADPDFAAEMLLSMLAGWERTMRLLGEAPGDHGVEEARLAAIVDTFLRAYQVATGENER